MESLPFKFLTIMDFIITLASGRTRNYSNDYDDGIEEEREMAWEDVEKKFPDAENIEAVY